ncbi:SsrA-binding protein [Winogradskyella luteola]|uniref:SsrA-binding protein n=1 Tax=Winogradskyella luteola TaxID=2828330 RepID=A0A9X1JMG5_9FLAO|nr:SsrA-binding protein [Winogradskyella luteola]MBV7268435.1 SsrA-binding protein [Winogradskyella luteola]
MKKTIFKALAKLNKAILPSYTKKQLDLSKASKLQLAIIGWRVYVTKNALDKKKTTDW